MIKASRTSRAGNPLLMPLLRTAETTKHEVWRTRCGGRMHAILLRRERKKGHVVPTIRHPYAPQPLSWFLRQVSSPLKLGKYYSYRTENLPTPSIASLRGTCVLCIPYSYSVHASITVTTVLGFKTGSDVELKHPAAPFSFTDATEK